MHHYYNPQLKTNARKLRNQSTNAEIILWSRLRRKQILNIPFYRQKPLGNYIVDFYAPAVNLIIEIDGGQHFEEENQQRDKLRDVYLTKNGFRVLRFDNLQVLRELDAVMGEIFNVVKERLGNKIRGWS